MLLGTGGVGFGTVLASRGVVFAAIGTCGCGENITLTSCVAGRSKTSLVICRSVILLGTLVSYVILMGTVVVLPFRGGSLVVGKRFGGVSMVVFSRLGLIRNLRVALARKGSGARKSV